MANKYAALKARINRKRAGCTFMLKAIIPVNKIGATRSNMTNNGFKIKVIF